jgi:hypothetical protein
VIVETGGGVLVRTIESASPLREDIQSGEAAEEATRDAASLWGLPDFVYRPALLALGSGSREIGDGTLIVGDRGVVIQVKARDREPADETRERIWLTKQIASGLRQAHGTIRSLRRVPVAMTNGRGRTLTVDGREVRWSAVVVVEHPGIPEGITPSVEQQPNPSLVLLRRDWEFLFEQLKSTNAVAQYVERVAGDSVELGQEVLRYFQLAQADEATPPGVIDPRILGPSGRQFSAPLLPMRAAATEDGRRPHLVVRTLLEDVAVSGGMNFTEADRLRMLAALDTLPVATRAEIGKFVLNAMDAMRKVSADVPEWRLRRVVGKRDDGASVQLGFGACSQPHSEMIQDLFGWWVLLRQHDLYQVVEKPDALVTVGLILTPCSDGPRTWDTTAVTMKPGDPQLTAAELAALREAWPIADDAA